MRNPYRLNRKGELEGTWKVQGTKSIIIEWFTVFTVLVLGVATGLGFIWALVNVARMIVR